jgi:hypothetical protein
MKKSLIIGTIALATALTGCKTTTPPSVESVVKLGTAVGYTTAYVLNTKANIDANTRATILDVVTKLNSVVPNTNETFSAKWTPIAKEALDAYRDNSGNAIPEPTKALTLDVFGYVASVLDFYVDKKGYRQYKDIVSVWSNSFCDSFLAAFGKSEAFAASRKNEEFDREIYEEILKLKR